MRKFVTPAHSRRAFCISWEERKVHAVICNLLGWKAQKLDWLDEDGQQPTIQDEINLSHYEHYGSLLYFTANSNSFASPGINSWELAVSVVFVWSVHSCHYPSVNKRNTGLHKLLIASDAQVPDSQSYASRGIFGSWLSQQIIYNYARKSWRLVMKQKPDTIVFLGDLLDNGVHAKDRLQ